MTATLFDTAAHVDSLGVTWRLGMIWEANELLAHAHYLGPLWSGGKLIVVGERAGGTVAAMIWKHPTSRSLPSDGSWLELARWCLTPGAGDNAGSRMHRWSVRLVREHLPAASTLVSYSDPAQGHTGALYRACNWRWAPTWLRLRPPPSGQGDWGTGRQEVKDRWVFSVRPDSRLTDVVAINDPAAVRHWQANANEQERRWAAFSPSLGDAS